MMYVSKLLINCSWFEEGDVDRVMEKTPKGNGDQ